MERVVPGTAVDDVVGVAGAHGVVAAVVPLHGDREAGRSAQAAGIGHLDHDAVLVGRPEVEQRAVRDRDRTGGRVDREAAAGVVDQGVGEGVAGIGIARRDDPDDGAVGRALEDRIGRKLEVARRLVGRGRVDRPKADALDPLDGGEAERAAVGEGQEAHRAVRQLDMPALLRDDPALLQMQGPAVGDPVQPDDVVGPAPTVEAIVAVAGSIDEQVVALAAPHLVVTGAALEHVVAVAAVEPVVAVAAAQRNRRRGCRADNHARRRHAGCRCRNGRGASHCRRRRTARRRHGRRAASRRHRRRTSWSFPQLPTSQSLPPWPSSRSSPARPCRRSRPSDPTSRSLPPRPNCQVAPCPSRPQCLLIALPPKRVTRPTLKTGVGGGAHHKSQARTRTSIHAHRPSHIINPKSKIMDFRLYSELISIQTLILLPMSVMRIKHGNHRGWMSSVCNLSRSLTPLILAAC